VLIDPYRFNSDEDFLDTFMLLHCENGQLYERTGFPVVSVVGGGVVSSLQAKFGTQSFSNPGTSTHNLNYVSVIGDPTDFTFPGELTIEGWFYVRSITDSFMNLFSNNINFPNAGFTQMAIRPGRTLFWNSSPGGTGETSNLVTLNQWTHLAVSRDASNVFRMFIDGVLGFTGTKAGTMGGASGGVSTFDVGRGIAPDNGDFDGFFEEIRVTKACRYTASFTPPTTVFPPFP
jgi:hypothetical protein